MSTAAEIYRRTVMLMSTCVTIQVVANPSGEQGPGDRREAVERAFDWFRRVEECCTRFNPQSELMQLASHVDVAVPVTPLLYEAVSFAIAVANETDGAFDPTVGRSMEARGFNREYRTGVVVGNNAVPARTVSDGSYRDVRLDPERQTITLLRPMTLDLGAVAKGLAIDMAARELRPLDDYAIDAGGDIYVGGRNPEGNDWTVGIRHPRRPDQLIDSIRVSNVAVCTSGDYERTSPNGGAGHHILDPRTGESPDAVVSVTVVAPTAMAADALATAAFVLGPAAGIQLLERQGVNGLIVSGALERFFTQEMRRVC